MIEHRPTKEIGPYCILQNCGGRYSSAEKKQFSAGVRKDMYGKTDAKIFCCTMNSSEGTEDFSIYPLMLITTAFFVSVFFLVFLIL
jgi:hypothetical protein